MKLFFINWHRKELGMIDVVKRLQRKHTITYWLLADIPNEVDTREFPGTIFHEHSDALEGRPAPAVDTSGFEPPSAQLLEQLSTTESTVLTMMNKLLGHLSVAERKHRYYRMLGYWCGVLKTNRPDMIIFPLVPHTVYDLIIYDLAKFLGIRTFMFTATQDFIRLLPMTDFTEGISELNREFMARENERVALRDIPEDIRSYITKHTEEKGNPTPPNMLNMKEKYGIRKSVVVLRALKDMTFVGKSVQYLRKRFGANLEREYQSVVRVPDLSKKFVYVPLQFQPEATTSPLGGVFVDQRLLIETLSAALPKDWVIYVKEHPRQFIFYGLNFSQYRYRGYYEGIAALKNVRVISTSTDTFSLIQASQAVALNTGTAGLEAVLRGKPVLAFGYAWYKECPGIFSVSSAASCRTVFERILSGFSIDRDKLLTFFSCVGRVSFKGYLEPHMQPLSGLSVPQNVDAVTNALVVKIG